MDQRDPMTLTGLATSYYMPDPVSGLQSSPNNMSPLSNSAIHFQSNTGPPGLSLPSLPLDTSPAMSGHGVGVGPPSMQLTEPVRRKRGRPRKYGHDGAVSLGLSPSVSTAAQKWRGRPPGSGHKHQLASSGGSMFAPTGTMTPHIINIAVGEDIKRKVLSLLQGRRALVVLSGVGSIAAANIKISSSTGSITYEGHFDMVNLSGSYINEIDSSHGATGGLNVTFVGPDGRLIGGPVEGVLIAASPVQVIAGTITASASKVKNRGLEDRDATGDQERTLGNSIAQANIQPSQSLSPMGVWQGSR